MRVQQMMSAPAVTVREDATLEQVAHIETAIRKMCEHDVHRLPVVRNGVPVGVVSRQDLLRLLIVPRMSRAAGLGDTSAVPSRFN